MAIGPGSKLKNMPSVFSGSGAESGRQNRLDRPGLNPRGGFSFLETAHMEPRARRRRPLLYALREAETGVFSPEQIAEANDRHDRHYGWSILYPGCYFNYGRLPETVIGPLPWEEPGRIYTVSGESQSA